MSVHLASAGARAAAGGEDVIPTYEDSIEETATTTSINLDVPAGTQEGDILVAIITLDTTATVTTPSGWTELYSLTSGTAIRAYCAYKIAGSSEPASYNFAFSFSSRIVGIMAAYGDVSISNPVDASDTNSGVGTSFPCPAVTASTPKLRILRICHAHKYSVFGPAGTTERESIAHSVGTAHCIAWLEDETQESSGDTGAISYTADTSQNYVASTVALT